MLFIHNDVVAELLTMEECIDAQEAAFRQLETGAAVHRPRLDLFAPCEREDGYYRWGTMEGTVDGIFAIRMKSDVLSWPRHEDGTWTVEKYNTRPGLYCGLVFLFSTLNGEPLAIINDGHIQHMRVGGGAGIGTRHLAREDARTVGMIGSGGMARTFLEAFCAVRPIERVKVFSPTPANREAYAGEMSARLGIEIVPVASVGEAARGADILSSCTDSMAPTFGPECLEPGMHVVVVTSREVSDAALSAFDVKIRQGTGHLAVEESANVQEGIGQGPTAFVAGSAEERKRLPPKTNRRTFAEDLPDFCDLVHGRAKGRESDGQITFYHNTGNQGLQFAAVGGLVYRKAKEKGLGREMPTEWFLQDIRD